MYKACFINELFKLDSYLIKSIMKVSLFLNDKKASVMYSQDVYYRNGIS